MTLLFYHSCLYNKVCHQCKNKFKNNNIESWLELNIIQLQEIIQKQERETNKRGRKWEKRRCVQSACSSKLLKIPNGMENAFHKRGALYIYSLLSIFVPSTIPSQCPPAVCKQHFHQVFTTEKLLWVQINFFPSSQTSSVTSINPLNNGCTLNKLCLCMVIISFNINMVT